MRSTLFSTVAAAALAVGTTVAFAQNPAPQSSGAAAPSMPPAGQSLGGGASPAPSRPDTQSAAPGRVESVTGQTRPDSAGAATGRAPTAPTQAHRETQPAAPARAESATGQPRPDTAASPPSGRGTTATGHTRPDAQTPAPARSDAAPAQTRTESASSAQRSTGTAGPSQSATSGAAAGSPAPAETARGTGRDVGTTGAISSTNISAQQRTTIHDTLVRHSRPVDVNFGVSVGAVIPASVALAEVPDEVVRIVPQYRGYSYVVVRDEVVIVEPRTKRVVEVIRRGAPSSASLNLAPEKRTLVKSRLASASKPVTRTVTIHEGTALPTEIELQPVPETIVTEFPELRSYSYFIDQDEVVLVEPQSRLVVEVIR
jgi:hypothetical protein